jgi:hypothetical protein
MLEIIAIFAIVGLAILGLGCAIALLVSSIER